MWARGARLLQLEVGDDWKDLIGCETLVFHSIFQTLMLGGIPPPRGTRMSADPQVTR